MGKGGGGHGGLNILPQKSWHVWNAKNLSQVERDEEKHQAEEAALQQKQREIEQERRLEILRKRKREMGTAGNSQYELSHVNFFEQEERQRASKAHAYPLRATQ